MKFPKRPKAPRKRKKKTPEELWKCTPRSLARVVAGSAYANEHVHTPGFNDDTPEAKPYTRWTAFEYGSEADMRKAMLHLKRVLSLENYPFIIQQRSLIVPKAAGKVITELYRSKQKFMSAIPLYWGKCALYDAFGLDKVDVTSLEYSAALKDLYYTTMMPWAGATCEEIRATSKSFVYAKRFDAVKRERMKKAQIETGQ
jgi:hypothetical protein